MATVAEVAPEKAPEAVSLPGILNNLAQVPIPPTTEKQRKQVEERQKRAEWQLMPDEEKAQEAWRLRKEGTSADAIARRFGISVRTVYRQLQQACSQYGQSLEGKTGLDVISEHVMMLQNVVDFCLYEVTQLGKDGRKFDAKTGEVVDQKESQFVKATKAKFLGMALKAQQMIINLQIATGILPSDPGRLYRTPAEEGKIATEEEKGGGVVRTREQLIADVLDKLATTRVLG